MVGVDGEKVSHRLCGHAAARVALKEAKALFDAAVGGGALEMTPAGAEARAFTVRAGKAEPQGTRRRAVWHPRAMSRPSFEVKPFPRERHDVVDALEIGVRRHMVHEGGSFRLVALLNV
jgi:hypothetical protein